MADIIEEALWEPGVREVGTGEPVSGGRTGTVNYSLQDLANRTLWLKQKSDRFEQGRVVNGAAVDFSSANEIITPIWGESRKISVMDASGSHEGMAVKVDGSRDISLLLPEALQAEIIGNVTGNLTGNVEGDVTGNLTGNADTATRLQNSRSINGTSFNGTGDITTHYWGTARNVAISDASGSNSGAAVSVNGGSAVNLKLPSTIKATLDGAASVAARLGRNGAAGTPMTFYWNGQAGQPSWLWGSNNGTDIYVYNPANFSVANAVRWNGKTLRLNHNTSDTWLTVFSGDHLDYVTKDDISDYVIQRTAGTKTPSLTPLFGSNAYKTGSGDGTIQLAQSWRNFDALMFVFGNDGQSQLTTQIVPRWLLEWQFNSAKAMGISCVHLFWNVANYWSVNPSLVTDTSFPDYDENCWIYMIVGIRY